jgi:hypothetical protein
MTTPLPVQWVKNASGDFLDLLRLNLDAPYFANPREGVYVIWYTGIKKAPVIKVGQGNIRDRLAAHRSNTQITQYSDSGQLKVSWVVVDREYFDGVEAFLYDYYKPLVGERKPGVASIPVTPLLSL